MTLQGKVAVVTGGSRGIGRELVRYLASHGCAVAFNYHHAADAAEELTTEMRGEGAIVQATAVDIQSYEAVKSWMDHVRHSLGGLDILINNAGILADKALMMMTSEEWRRVIDTNLTGVFNASRAVIVPFMKQKSGNIINISSISGIIGLPRQVNYSASKGGVNAFTKALAKEVAGYNIRVNAVAPGYIETDMLSGLDEARREQILKEIPLQRLGRSEDVAGLVGFLLSPAAGYITGQILRVDGGLAL